ncbi:hypothetical protein DL768_007241 [Monosporascus sp. mg162]|nr:hypothetical protein DL768_007241 [Monosporascus sp. mg162]
MSSWLRRAVPLQWWYFNAKYGASKRGGDFYPCIMPLGDSITKGDPAEPNGNGKNGYRKPLRDRLRVYDWKVNMVGSVQNYGTTNDGYLRALILINARTNDANNRNPWDESVVKTQERMELMIWEAFSIILEALIVLSCLFPNGFNQNNVGFANANYRTLARKMYDQDYHVVLTKHKIAAIWREAIRFGEAKDWLRPPSADVNISDGNDGTPIYWHSGGIGEKAGIWQDMGLGCMALAVKGMGDIRGVLFVNINGYHRDDWIWISTDGRTTTWVDQRGEGKGMVPRWLDSGVTYTGGFDVYHRPSRDNIQFGGIFGSGRHDYARIERKNCRNANETRGCEINNVGEVLNDYIWISPNGTVDVFPNPNMKGEVSRDITGDIWDGLYSRPRNRMDRRALHIGDRDGEVWDDEVWDDVITVNKATDALTVWRSNWVWGTNFGFTRSTIPNSDKCKTGTLAISIMQRTSLA